MRVRVLISLTALTTVLALAAIPVGAQDRGAQGGRGGGGGRGFSLPPLMMTTDAFADGAIVPEKYAGRGTQPGFKFTGAPANTVAYAIIFHDLDVSLQNNTDDVLHWMVWNIPASANGIPEGSLPEGSVAGTASIGKGTYFGPGAPAGERYHHYVFELYALSQKLDLPATATRAELLAAMNGKITAKAAYVGRYHQMPK